MIRTKRGFFFDEFVHKKFIAIGWNLVSKDMISTPLSKSQTKILKESIKETYDEKKPGTALNKCKRFCNELKTGDICLIVGRDKIAIAYIGEYFERNIQDLTIDLEKDIHKQIENANIQSSFNCPYTKCRKISVIKVIDSSDNMSPYLQAAIARNWHSLSDLTEYAELILSACFDTFCFKNKTTITFRVNQTSDINALDLATFILKSANIISNNSPEKISVKTTLHSPGDIVLTIQDLFSQVDLLLVYIAIFGGRFGKYELNSVVSAIKYVFNRKAESEKQEIEKQTLKTELEIKNEQLKEQRIKNIERLKNLNLSPEDLESISKVSKRLKISLSEDTIKDVQNALAIANSSVIQENQGSTDIEIDSGTSNASTFNPIKK